MTDEPSKNAFPPVDARRARREQILVEVQKALSRQTRRRRSRRKMTVLLAFLATGGMLAWRVGLVGTPEIRDSFANQAPSDDSPPDLSAALRPTPPARILSDIVVHTNPDVLDTVVVSSKTLLSKSSIETVNDDELAQLLAETKARFIVARIDKRLVAIPKPSQTDQRLQ
jgi:hypothetical protein